MMIKIRKACFVMVALGLLVLPVVAQAQSVDEQLTAFASTVNGQLALSGVDFRLDRAEYLSVDPVDASEEMSQTVFFNNRTLQLGAHFVPGDPRRGGGTDITVLVDQTEGATTSGLSTAATTAAIDRAMATWDAVTCSTLPVTRFPDIPGLDLGVVEFLNGLGGLPVALADLTHAGWLPAGLLPNNVIGVTFTFIFVNGGNPTDINNDGKTDVAFREILYNDRFNWQINANIDVETVALHESGHGLSQGHFGKLFRTDANGKFHFAPRSVMNAGYTGVQQVLQGTDNGGHCSIWGSWPQN